MVKNPYLKNKILNATPPELTLILYDGAIQYANLAKKACEKKEIEKAHNNIRKCDLIIEEFQLTLDFNYDVANDFNNVYTYIRQRLLQANLKKDAEIMSEVLRHLQTMKETWKEVMVLNGYDNDHNHALKRR